MSTFSSEKGLSIGASSFARDQSGPTSPIWQAALDRYYEELRKGGIKDSFIDKDLWNVETPDDLLTQIETLAPPEAQSSKAWMKVLTQLQSVLLGLNDFAAIIAWSMGMDGKVAAVLWGSIRLMIKVLTLLLVGKWPLLNTGSSLNQSFQILLIC